MKYFHFIPTDILLSQHFPDTRYYLSALDRSSHFNSVKILSSYVTLLKWKVNITLKNSSNQGELHYIPTQEGRLIFSDVSFVFIHILKRTLKGIQDYLKRFLFSTPIQRYLCLDINCVLLSFLFIHLTFTVTPIKIKLFYISHYSSIQFACFCSFVCAVVCTIYCQP